MVEKGPTKGRGIEDEKKQVILCLPTGKVQCQKMLNAGWILPPIKSSERKEKERDQE